MAALRRHGWPGNVRELLNILERLAILHSDSLVGAAEVAGVLPTRTPAGGHSAGYIDGDPRPLRDRLDDYERSLIEGALRSAGGNMAEAGRRLQTDRANLYRRMRRLGLRDAEEG